MSVLIKRIFFVLFILVLANCSHHEQENFSTQEVQKNSEEKNPVKRIQKVIFEGDADGLRALLDADLVDINSLIDDGASGSTFLVQALLANKFLIAEILIEYGADPEVVNKDKESAYSLFSKDDVILNILNKEAISEEILLKILIDDGISPNRLTVVRWIRSKGININQKVGRTPPPLIYAANLGFSEEEMYPLIEELLAYEGVDINISFRRRTALGLVKKKSYQNIVKMLLDHGATE